MHVCVRRLMCASPRVKLCRQWYVAVCGNAVIAFSLLTVTTKYERDVCRNCAAFVSEYINYIPDPWQVFGGRGGGMLCDWSLRFSLWFNSPLGVGLYELRPHPLEAGLAEAGLAEASLKKSKIGDRSEGKKQNSFSGPP